MEGNIPDNFWKVENIYEKSLNHSKRIAGI